MANTWEDVLTDGLMNYIELSGDPQDGKMGAQLASLMNSLIASQIRPDDQCSYAYATAVIRAKQPERCLFMILGDRVLSFWETGVIRSKSGVETIPLAAITDVTVGKNSHPRLRNAAVLAITHTQGALEVLLPVERTQQVAAGLKAALMPGGASATPASATPLLVSQPPPVQQPPAPAVPPHDAPPSGPKACRQPACSEVDFLTLNAFCPRCGSPTEPAVAPHLPDGSVR